MKPSGDARGYEVTVEISSYRRLVRRSVQPRAGRESVFRKAQDRNHSKGECGLTCARTCIHCKVLTGTASKVPVREQQGSSGPEPRLLIEELCPRLKSSMNDAASQLAATVLS